MITVALIGRTNVGKSSLFNRIISEAKALVSEIAHTTRDRVTGTTVWRGVDIRCMDTGGVESMTRDRSDAMQIEREIRKQVARAAAEADALILVVDARDGVLPGERAIANDLRKLHKPILVVWNKSETPKLRASIGDASALGLGDAYPTSAVTGMGVGDLLDAIVEIGTRAREHQGTRAPGHEGMGPEALKPSSSTIATRVAIVGEPNVGKSSILNAILGREEVIVAQEPFTTRDVHDVEAEVDGQPVILLDTAGIRRLAVRATRGVKTRIEAIERLAVARSLRAIERADVVVFVLDAMLPATRHVKQLADAIVTSGRACVVLVNKVDLLPEPPDADAIAAHVHRQCSHLDWAIVASVSAVTGSGISTILPAAIRAATAWRRQLDAHQLAAIHARTKSRIPTARTRDGRKRSHIVELQQVGTAPPRFILITRKRVKLPKAIPAILERAIRDSEDFAGSPIRIIVKSVKG